MYTDVFKVKKMVHHIQRIPLPFPMTAMGIIAGAAVLLAMFYFDVGDLAVNLGIALIVAGWISHYEPDGIGAFQIFYAYVRQLFRAKRRVVNRPVMVPKQHPELKYVGGLTRIELKKEETNHEHDGTVLRDAQRMVSTDRETESHSA